MSESTTYSEEYIWKGTGLKYAVTMTCAGFDMDSDNWTITVARGSQKMVFDRDNAVQDDQGQWYICIDTADLAPGRLDIIFDAHVPDGDFESGIRHEIQKYTLTNLKNL